MSETFTKEELEAVEWPSDWMKVDPGWLDDHIPSSEHAQDALLRLALEHHERAHLALGEGWSCAPSGIVISSPIINTDDGALVSISIRNPTATPPGFILTVIRESGEEGVGTTWSLPPEFDAILARGRNIDAAWKRIEEKA